MSTNGIMLNGSMNIGASDITSGYAVTNGENQNRQAVSFAELFMGSMQTVSRLEESAEGLKTTTKTEYKAMQKTDVNLREEKTCTDAYAAETEVMETEVMETEGEMTTNGAEAVEQVTEDAPVAENVEEVSEETFEKVATLLNEVVQTILTTLDITPEELEGYLAENNLEPSDLLDAEVLKAMTLHFNGEASPLDILTDENLQMQLEQLTGKVEELVEEFKEENPQIEDFEATVKACDKDMVIVKEDGTKEFFIAKPEKTVDSELEDEKPDNRKVKTEKNFTTEDKGEHESNDEKVGRSEKNASANDHQSNDLTKRESSDNNLFTQFTDKLVNAAKQTADMTGEVNGAYRMTEIVNQFTEQIKISVSPSKTSLEMTLNPENLGKISFGITSKDGVMTAQIKCDNQVTKEALESQMQTLKETIESRGIEVEAIEVTVSNFEFGQSKDTQSEDGRNEDGQKKRTGKLMNSEDGESTEDYSHLRANLDGNSTVNYVA